MKLEFKLIEISNFMSFAHEKFDFSKCNGLNLIRGKNNDNHGDPNECGKSNLWKALTYAFFGEIQHNLKNESLVNFYSDEKDMDVAVSFNVDACSYIVRRGLLKRKSSYLKLSKIEDGKEIDLTKSSIQETQRLIEEEIIHCDITIFLRTIFLTADQNYNFYMLKTVDKKEFVEKLFDISIFGDMHQAIHKDVLAIDKEMLSLQNRLIVLSKNNSDYKERSEKYIKDIECKKSTYAAQLKEIESKISSLKSKKLSDTTKQSLEISKSINDITSRKDKSFIELNDIKEKLHKIDIASSKLSSSKDNKSSMLKKHSGIIGKLCNDCKTIFMKHYNIDTYPNEINKIDEDLNKLDAAKKKINESVSKKNNEINSFSSEIDNLKKNLEKLNEENNKVSRDLSILESKADSIKLEIEHLEHDKNPYSEMIESNSKTMKEENESLEKYESRHNYLKFAENIVSQDTLRKFIIKDLVVLLNNRIKTYLTKLGSKYYVNFNENMDYEFITEKGKYEFNNFSSGGKMRIMIATSFAFRDFMSIRNGLTSNILVLDEYFDSAISSNCIESTMGILEEYSRNLGQNIFIISHRQEMNPEMFDRTLIVEKTNGMSKITINNNL